MSKINEENERSNNSRQINYWSFNYTIGIKLGGNLIFTTFLVLLFIFTTTKRTFSKISYSLSGKRLLYVRYLYI